MKRYMVGLGAVAALLALTVGMASAQEKKKGNPVVVLETSKGIIEIELNEAKAPVSVANFLKYVDMKFYDGLIFHRVIADFMIQGGGFTPEMAQKQGLPPIKNEAGNGLANDKYTIAMARTNVVDSATSQFFINVAKNSMLDDSNYCVFGKVVAGMDVVDAIAQVPTGSKRGYNDIPLTPITILSATVL